MPPRRAAPFSIMREPKTASASPRTSGSTIAGRNSGAYWPSACSITMMSRSCSAASR